MDSQLNNYTLSSADNKGILSLLTAIEQSGDCNYDASEETSPSKIMDKEAAETYLTNQLNNMDSVNNLEGALEMAGDINLPGFSQCMVCGKCSPLENPHEAGMLDVFSELSLPGEEKGTSVFSVLAEIISLELDSSRSAALVCVDCVSVVEAVLKLRAQIAEYSMLIRSRHEDWGKRKAKFPSVSDYASVLDLKMPLNIFNIKEDDGSGVGGTNMLTSSKESGGPIMNRKSKLDILAETLEGEQRVDLEDQSSLNKENETRKPETICDKCGKSFRIGPAKKNTRTPRTSCNACLRETRVKPVAVGSKTFPCPKCNKIFKSKWSMNDHLNQVHMGLPKSYSCSECLETFTSKHVKAVHERLHKGSKGLQCAECGVSFQTFQSLQHHRSKHTGEFSYNCESCGKGFNNFKLLEEHCHTHTGDKPYACTECNKSFANRGSLWLHRKKHANKKPYVCEYCNKQFGHSSHLVVHKRMHTGETPYKCRFCDEGFISGNHLKRHMKTHSNSLPFACGLCKAEFSKRSDLVKHGNSLHSGNVVDAVKDQEEQQCEIKEGAGDEDKDVVMVDQKPSLVPMPEETHTETKEGSRELKEGEYAEILVEHQERMLLNRLVAENGEYMLPVSLLEGGEEGNKERSEEEQEGTIVYIQIPSNQFLPEERID